MPTPPQPPQHHAAPARLSRREVSAWLAAALGGGLGAGPGLALASDAAPSPSAPALPFDGRTSARLSAYSRLGLQQAKLPAECLGAVVRPVTSPHATAWQWQEDRPFVMASATKLVTSMAALDLLGPGYRWRTLFLLDGPVVDGRLLGNLRIVGGGDGRLTGEELQTAFQRIRERGLREIDGHILIDRQAFALSEDDFAGTPLPAGNRPEHQRPDAFVLDDGVVGVMVGHDPNDPLKVDMATALAGVQVRLADWAPGSRCDTALDLKPLLAEPVNGRTDWRLHVHGRWNPACGSKRVVAASMPHDWFTARAVAAAWQGAGGQLAGRVMEKPDSPFQTVSTQNLPTPDKAFYVHESPRLAQWLSDINKHSHNLLARQLMLSLSPSFPRRPATLDGARKRVDQWAQRQAGLAKGQVVVDNGSGLSRGERGTPDALVRLLQRAWTRPWRDVFVKSLPIAGVDGTLHQRFKQGPAAGRAFLKTGSLSDARALAGYLEGKSGMTYAVALFVNHERASAAVPVLDGLVERMIDEL